MIRPGFWMFFLIFFCSNLWGADNSFRHFSNISNIPDGGNLKSDADLSRTHGVPILLMFGASDCEYCEILENDFLYPMAISGDYDNKIMFRKIMIDGIQSLIDFSGNLVDVESFAEQFNVTVTPTVVIVDNNGRELAPRIMGIGSYDFYGYYLDEAINYSVISLRHRAAKSTSVVLK